MAACCGIFFIAHKEARRERTIISFLAVAGKKKAWLGQGWRSRVRTAPMYRGNRRYAADRIADRFPVFNFLRDGATRRSHSAPSGKLDRLRVFPNDFNNGFCSYPEDEGDHARQIVEPTVHTSIKYRAQLRINLRSAFLCVQSRRWRQETRTGTRAGICAFFHKLGQSAPAYLRKLQGSSSGTSEGSRQQPSAVSLVTDAHVYADLKDASGIGIGEPRGNRDRRSLFGEKSDRDFLRRAFVFDSSVSRYSASRGGSPVLLRCESPAKLADRAAENYSPLPARGREGNELKRFISG
jgi:hypothetical protein